MSLTPIKEDRYENPPPLARHLDQRLWGVNFPVIKLGLTTVYPFILEGIRFTLCALPAIFFIPKPGLYRQQSWLLQNSYGDLHALLRS
ncbi:MAG: putative permease [Pseudomonas sp.]|uniref:hypothetical protein n=1 Tax=Pseudomonas sp. TaxID=306 RepID=UPI00345A91DD|nr:putative permease [Pseudomonas sp.]